MSDLKFHFPITQLPSLDTSNILMDTSKSYKFYNKFAPVVPFHFYQQFLVNSYIPLNVLLLAHDVVQNAEAYAETFAHPAWNNTTIFMDNSLVELKQAVDIKMVKEAVNIINRPNMVVILPDVMGESELTTEATLAAWDSWSWTFRDHQRLVVIQGPNMPTWLACAESLAHLNPEWVSIPRITEGAFGYHRRELIPFIEAIFPNSKLHLLGFSDYIWEDLRAAAHPSVKSIDSAVPFRMETMDIFSEQIPPRGDWWEKAKFDPSMIDRVVKINRIIELMK